MIRWLDRLQQRSRVMGYVIAVIYKYVGDQGGYLAALITYYAFVSLFPLLLLLTTVLGVVLSGRPEWREQIVSAAIDQFPVISDQLSRPEALSGGTTAVIIGIAGMRNRPLKTFLTTATVTLLTFTILVFASFESGEAVTETYLGRSSGTDRTITDSPSPVDVIGAAELPGIVQGALERGVAALDREARQADHD